MTNRTRFSTLFLSFLFYLGNGQVSRYSWPMDSLLPITGNYGEIRPNHFHTGIDLSTKGKEGLPVYAVEDGSVSRIRINSGGFGRCVYIRHDNGQVSVYAHLNDFTADLQNYLFAELYKRQVYELDLTVPPNVLKIKKGQLIGHSGNSGGSSGPHLHFEIRDDKSEVPLNPLLYLKKEDKVAPQLSAIAWYELSDPKAPKLLHFQKATSASPVLKLPDFVTPSCYIGFAFAAFDLLQPAGNKNQVNAARLLLDGNEIYAHIFTGLRFENNRFVNEFADRQGGFYLQKCFLPENYPSGIYASNKSDGQILLKDTLWHLLKLELRDEAGNVTTVQQSVRCHILSPRQVPVCKGELISAKTPEALRNSKAVLRIPPNGLYNDACVQLKTEGNNVQILPVNVNFASPWLLVVPVPPELKDKAAKIIFKSGKSILTPEISKDSLYLEIKNSGTYTMSTDVVNPEVKALWKPGKNGAPKQSLRFLMRDIQSGIERFELLVNGQWTFAYFDAKNDLLILDRKGLPKGPLRIRLFVTDKCENVTVFSTTFNP